MKRRTFLLTLAPLALLLLAPPARADDGKAVTLKGKLACAMCILKQPDAKGCKNVLVVSDHGKDVVYALVENDVMKGYEMAACEKAIPVTVTGTLADVSGKKTLTPTKIQKG